MLENRVEKGIWDKYWQPIIQFIGNQLVSVVSISNSFNSWGACQLAGLCMVLRFIRLNYQQFLDTFDCESWQAGQFWSYLKFCLCACVLKEILPAMHNDDVSMTQLQDILDKNRKAGSHGTDKFVLLSQICSKGFWCVLIDFVLDLGLSGFAPLIICWVRCIQRQLA